MFAFWLKSPLYMPVGAGSGGGAGAGAGSGQGSGQGDGTPAAFDAAAFKTEMVAEINKAVNGIAKEFKKGSPSSPSLAQVLVRGPATVVRDLAARVTALPVWAAAKVALVLERSVTPQSTPNCNSCASRSARSPMITRNSSRSGIRKRPRGSKRSAALRSATS